jgi:hypothetical protein
LKYVGMVLGGILSAVGHMIAFIFKNIFIAIRRFTMDPANKNALWNMQAFSILIILIFCFLWMVGKYQDVYYGVGAPVFYRAIPLLIPCFLGHLIYSCPVLFKSTYAKPIIQTFLNALSVMAAGDIVMKFVPVGKGIIIACIMLVGAVTLTLYYTLHINIRSTVFNKLIRVVEEADMQATENKNPGRKRKGKGGKDGLSPSDLIHLDKIDLNQIGCLGHLRYYSEDCKLELFNTIPTKERQSELKVLTRSDRAQHSQIIGGTGAGKTLLATNLIAQDLLNDYIGSTIIEPKGSLINRLANFMDRTGRTYHRLDPEYEFTDCLNPFYVPEGQDIEPMIEANVSAFHGYLGPDAVDCFKSRATNLLRVGIKALKLVYGNECTYNELDRLIQPMNDDFRAEVMSELRGHENQVPLLLEYTRNMAGTSKMQEHAMQTYSNLYDYLSELTSNKYIQRIFCGPSTFNIDDVLANGEIVLVNGAYGTLQTLTYTVGRLYINLLRASTFRRSLKEKVRPHQLTVDELEMFADEEFSTFLEMAREFEVFVNVIHQGNVQLEDVSERLSVMVKQNAVQKFILAGLDNDDAEYYADMIGEDYQIGLSTGTDEMSATGFKTQLKEEKRYRVLPSEILRLKGYNSATGDPGECLFRGVQNNVRMDPVFGLIYPLPRKLFMPLTSAVKETHVIVYDKPEKKSENEKIKSQNKKQNEIEQNVEEINEEIEKNAEEILKSVTEIQAEENNGSLLDRIKQRGKQAIEKGKGAQSQNIGEQVLINENTIRNSAWDTGGQQEENAATEKGTEGNTHSKNNIEEPHRRNHQPAIVGESLIELEERMAQKAEVARKNKGTSEAG